jgi:hypothetical protein
MGAFCEEIIGAITFHVSVPCSKWSFFIEHVKTNGC